MWSVDGQLMQQHLLKTPPTAHWVAAAPCPGSVGSKGAGFVSLLCFMNLGDCPQGHSLIPIATRLQVTGT